MLQLIIFANYATAHYLRSSKASNLPPNQPISSVRTRRKRISCDLLANMKLVFQPLRFSLESTSIATVDMLSMAVSTSFKATSLAIKTMLMETSGAIFSMRSLSHAMSTEAVPWCTAEIAMSPTAVRIVRVNAMCRVMLRCFTLRFLRILIMLKKDNWFYHTVNISTAQLQINFFVFVRNGAIAQQCIRDPCFVCAHWS